MGVEVARHPAAKPHPLRQMPKVCSFWRSGRCARHPCAFLHSEIVPPEPSPFHRHRIWRNPNTCSATIPSSKPSATGAGVPPPRVTENQETSRRDSATVCGSFLAGNCSYGERCRHLHAWSVGDSVSLVATLEGQHQNVITGIALPSGSNKLFSGSKDGTIRIWDCKSGECIQVLNLGVHIGCIISEGGWVFVGVPDAVKAWNMESGEDISLVGPEGQVYALATSGETLFAGSNDGKISAWRSGNILRPTASLTGHGGAVVTLKAGVGRLYSGSMDCTIRVWDLANLQCMHTLTGHKEVVMSVLCWDQYLISCSLDRTIKVWTPTESLGLEAIYTHREEHGLLALLGMDDESEHKPLLLASCNDNSVRIFDLPSFVERGRIFSKEEVRALQLGPGGLFFTGDGTGELKVWKWRAREKEAAAA